MNAYRYVLLLTSLCLMMSLIACDRSASQTPMAVVLHLLDLHELRGVLPEQRGADVRETPVPREKLRPLFSDLDAFDPFIGDLYVGVIVGALARHQSDLEESIVGSRATVGAGAALIHFEQRNGRWKISLDRTIPEDMKTRAVMEKRAYDAARTAGQAAFPNLSDSPNRQ